MDDQLPFETELIERIGWLIQLRWLAVLGTFLAISLGAVLFVGLLPLGALYGVIAVVAAYNFVFLRQLGVLRQSQSQAHRLSQAKRFACLQIVVDLVALASLVHFAGGMESPFLLFFVLHIILSSILLERRVSFIMACVAIALIFALAGLEYWGLLPHYRLPIPTTQWYQDGHFLLLTCGTLALVLLLVVYLTASIAARLRQRTEELMVSNFTCQMRSADLERLNEELRRLDEERTRFMVLVTHELRAPVNTIYSALDLALSKQVPVDKSRDILARAQVRASELLDLIGDLLDLTRAREQAVALERIQTMSLIDPLQDVVDFVRVEAEKKNVTLVTEIEPHLSPVRALPDPIKVVWTNLLSNAIKYTEPGGQIRVVLNQDDAYVVGTVSDTGIGIAAEDVEQVFEEFFRARNARQMSPHGTGIGLAIVRRLVENFDGWAWVESELGQGTTFGFALPRADVTL